MSYYNVTVITPYMNITGFYIYIYIHIFIDYNHVKLIIDTYYNMIR